MALLFIRTYISLTDIRETPWTRSHNCMVYVTRAGCWQDVWGPGFFFNHWWLHNQCLSVKITKTLTQHKTVKNQSLKKIEQTNCFDFHQNKWWSEPFWEKIPFFHFNFNFSSGTFFWVTSEQTCKNFDLAPNHEESSIPKNWTHQQITFSMNHTMVAASLGEKLSIHFNLNHMLGHEPTCKHESERGKKDLRGEKKSPVRNGKCWWNAGCHNNPECQSCNLMQLNQKMVCQNPFNSHGHFC